MNISYIGKEVYMKPKLFTILNIFLTLSLFSFFGCATSQKAYDGPKLPPNQIARIICKTRPIAIETMWTKGGPTQLKKRGWGIKPGFGATSWTLEVLPGKYNIKFRIPETKYTNIILTHPVTVQAGRVYTIECYKKSKRCFMSEVVTR
jgi:hypothetical protein